MGSSDKNSEYRNIILISQVGICVMIPMFLCMALGIWLDKKFGTYFTLPFLSILDDILKAAGCRYADSFIMNIPTSAASRSPISQRYNIANMAIITVNLNR